MLQGSCELASLSVMLTSCTVSSCKIIRFGMHEHNCSHHVNVLRVWILSPDVCPALEFSQAYSVAAYVWIGILLTAIWAHRVGYSCFTAYILLVCAIACSLPHGM